MGGRFSGILGIFGRPSWLGAGAAIAVGLSTPALAESPWDSVISNSHWYVPVANMLAYGSSGTSFANPFPVGDQTLWTLGTSTNGVFSGSSSAELAVGPITTPSSMTVQGVVTTAGQITMLFTDPSTGLVTVGLGMMREVDGVNAMEMQMITGTSLLVTHWAYMLPYDPSTFTPPSAQVVPSNASPQWAWTQGTPWRIVSPSLFGTAAAGRLVITNYKSGYFWGQAVAPSGTWLTVLGSITPEGKVLLSALPDTSATLTSLYGDISGSSSDAQMDLGTYDSSGNWTGDGAVMSLVQPYVTTLLATGNPGAIGAATTLYRVGSTPAGLFGPLASAIAALDGLSGPALSAALSQTLPVLAGNAARATYDTQRGLQQMVTARLAGDGTQGGTGAWLQPFGAFASQTTQAGYAGFNARGGGFIAGIDGQMDGGPALTLDQGGVSGLRLGGFFAYSDTSLSSTAIGAPSSLDVASYAFGLYGSAALPANLALDLQVDGAFNANSERRTVGFAGANASADYDSYTFHAGAGLRQIWAVSRDLEIQPTARLDYARVDAQSYTESGAGALDLSVAAQTYQELMISAGLRGAYALAGPVQLTAYAGAGYNALDTGSAVTASFLGGGGSFVTTNADLSPWLFTAGAALASARLANFDLRLGYDIQASPSGFLNQMGSLSLRVRL